MFESGYYISDNTAVNILKFLDDLPVVPVKNYHLLGKIKNPILLETNLVPVFICNRCSDLIGFFKDCHSSIIGLDKLDICRTYVNFTVSPFTIVDNDKVEYHGLADVYTSIHNLKELFDKHTHVQLYLLTGSYYEGRFKFSPDRKSLVKIKFVNKTLFESVPNNMNDLDFIIN